MGQYFKAVVLSTEDASAKGIEAAFTAWDYNNGAKLLEHSWQGNDFVRVVERAFTPFERFYKHRLVWAGDYAEPEKEEGKTLYVLAEKFRLKKAQGNVSIGYRYLHNHSKKEYVDINVYFMYENALLHPLPLLTFQSNLDGVSLDAGDAFKFKLGRWARDIISVENSVMEGYKNLFEE